ncbi:TraR/DksA family transcriptional regulator [Nakamurella aerolata]|uniref:TraR/DksA family transcriptional regulator n=1 Tax=Nakamurella aerolata TaxID=1656892 RepID=A0A849A2Z9_9ACTN|nr:TraR/DksA family transcriptional regulator [Nakamurella aerolata]
MTKRNGVAALRKALKDRTAETQQLLETAENDLVNLRAAKNAESDDDEHDPDGATMSAEWSRLEGRAADARDELAQLEQARRRLDDGDPAVCVDCGEPIPMERLLVRPMADRCVDCAERTGR